MSHPLPPLRPTGQYTLPDGKNYHIYISCIEEDINNVSTCIKRLIRHGCKCVEFFGDGAAYLPEFKQMEKFLCQSRWIGLYITEDFLKSAGTQFQIEVFVYHVVNMDKQKRIILLITDESVIKKIPAILQPFKKVRMYDEEWEEVLSRIILKNPKDLRSEDMTKRCGNPDHVDINKMVRGKVHPKAYTVAGPVSTDIIPLHKYRDAKISNMAQRAVFKPSDFELPSEPKENRKPKSKSASSTRSAASFISGVSSEDSGIPEDLSHSLYCESDDEMDDLEKSYQETLDLPPLDFHTTN